MPSEGLADGEGVERKDEGTVEGGGGGGGVMRKKGADTLLGPVARSWGRKVSRLQPRRDRGKRPGKQRAWMWLSPSPLFLNFIFF